MAGTIVSQRHTEESWSESDEIDLARYFGVLRRRWLEIVLVTVGVVVLTASGVLLYRQMTPPVYEANATAAIVRTSTDVRFDERFTTSSDQPGNLDVNSRRTALVALVKSGSIAQQVIDELGDQLPLKLQSPAKLLDAVTAEMATAAGRAGPERPDPDQRTGRVAGAGGSHRQRLGQGLRAAGQQHLWPGARRHARLGRGAVGRGTGCLRQSASQPRVLPRHQPARRAHTPVRATAIRSTILQQGKVNALNAYMEQPGRLLRQHRADVRCCPGGQPDSRLQQGAGGPAGARRRLPRRLQRRPGRHLHPAERPPAAPSCACTTTSGCAPTACSTAARTLQEQVADSASGNTLAGSALALQVLNLQMVNAAATTPPQASTDYLTPGQPQPQQQRTSSRLSQVNSR